MNELSKKAIYDIYCIMKEYLRYENLEDEESYSELFYEIEKRKLIIPSDIYDKIVAFIDDNIASYVHEDAEHRCEKCFENDNVAINQDGNYEIKDIDALEKIMIIYQEQLYRLNKKLDDFAMQELRPYLIDKAEEIAMHL